jgi:hypothetical protein
VKQTFRALYSVCDSRVLRMQAIKEAEADSSPDLPAQAGCTPAYTRSIPCSWDHSKRRMNCPKLIRKSSLRRNVFPACREHRGPASQEFGHSLSVGHNQAPRRFDSPNCVVISVWLARERMISGQSLLHSRRTSDSTKSGRTDEGSTIRP